MQQIKAHRTLSRRRAWPLALTAGMVVVWGLPASTQAASTCTDQSCPTDFIQLTSPEIQSTKTSFKFQARISQAKLPVDDVTFNKVIVKLRDGVNTWCSQSLSNVKVRDSVLNLEVGPDTGMTCSMPLEDLIAGKNGLGFQICINNEENCLKPIALSSVPYSVKAEYARRAQQAFEADVAAQAHYAHRIAADLDLLQAPTIGTGYYDFHTPLSAVTVPGLNIAISNKEGVMQWTPVATAEKKLNIVLKNEANGATPASFSRLDELKLHAVLTRDLGKLEVSEGTKLFSTLDVTGATTMASTLAVTGATTLNSTLLTKGATTLQSTLAVTGATTLNSTLLAKGATTVQNTLNATGATTLGSTLGVTGATTLSSTLGVTGATTLGSTLAVTGATTLSGGLTVAAPPASVSHSIAGPTAISGATQMTGSLSITSTGGLNVDAISNLTTLKVPSAGSATFDGSATFNSGATFNGTTTFTGTVNLPAINSASFTTLNLPFAGLKMGSDDNIRFGTTASNVVSFGAGVKSSTIAGGISNMINGNYGFIGGGTFNSVGAFTAAVVAGGQSNSANGDNAVVGGGALNQANAATATVGGGSSNTASGISATVGGGSGNSASGVFATVPGGKDNSATGDYAIAMGNRARGSGKGSFTWADNAGIDFTNGTDNSFKARATGGFVFQTSSNQAQGFQGVTLNPGGGGWNVTSDRNMKHEIREVDPKQVLAKLDSVAVGTWRYKLEVSQALHMGPMAQDFYAAFGLGDDEKHIGTVDADGVALAAVKGVHAVTKEQQVEITELKGELKHLRDQNNALEARLAKLERSGGKGAAGTGLGMFGTLGFAGFAGLGMMLVAGRRRKDLP